MMVIFIVGNNMFKRKFSNVASVLYQNRYCSQENFDIVVGGTLNYTKTWLLHLSYPGLDKIDPILAYKPSKYSYSSVAKNSDIYTFCEQVDLQFFRYEGEDSELHKYHKKVVLPENVKSRLACSFMEHLFIFNNYHRRHQDKPYIKYCLKYNIKTLHRLIKLI